MSIKIDEKTQTAVDPESIVMGTTKRVVWFGIIVSVLVVTTIALKVTGIL